jgi:hypothetical protein
MGPMIAREIAQPAGRAPPVGALAVSAEDTASSYSEPSGGVFNESSALGHWGDHLRQSAKRTWARTEALAHCDAFWPSASSSLWEPRRSKARRRT